MVVRHQWCEKGGMVAKLLVCWTPYQVIWVVTMAQGNALHSLVRHFTLTVPLPSQLYKSVTLAN